MSARMAGQISTSQRRALAAALVGAVSIGLAGTPATAQAPTTAPAEGAPVTLAAEESSVGTSVATLTLVTGDLVRVVTGADGIDRAYVVEDPADPQPGALVVRTGGDLAVYPTEALPYLRSGALDPALFDVSALLEQGLDDASADALQLMASSPSSPVTTGEPATGDAAPIPTAPPASEVTATAPWLGLVGLRVAKADAREFWAALESADADADGEASLRRGIGRLWQDHRVRVALDGSVGQIGAPAAYAQGLDGTGVTVAVLDTGIDDQHPDVAGAVVAQQDFTGEGTTDDLFGHGTHVASIIAGTGELSGGTYRGVAPGATLLDGRVLDAGGYGDESWIIAGMEWAAQQGADIANMSLGGWPTDGTDPLSAAVDALTAEYGTLFVIAAGNEYNGTPASNPGAASAALTVGSVGRTDVLSEFSSGAPRLGDAAIKPELSAPGEEIVAAQADGTELGPVVAPGYVALSGTSMATPHVAGAAALLAERYPDWTAAELKADLVSTTAPLDSPVYRAGTGRLDVAAALATDGLAVDVGTLGFGFFAWPHTDDQPVTRTVTYTNAGGSDVTLDLAASLSEAVTGEELPGAVKVTPTVVTVPAGGSAPVEVTVQPGAEPGQWSGTLEATAADGRVLRTGLGFESEPERYDLRVTVLGADGQPTYADLFLLNLDTGEIADSWLRTDPDAPFRVSPGRWTVLAAAGWGDQTGTTLALGVEPEVSVSGDAELVVDLRRAKPFRVAPDDDDVVQSSASIGVLRTAPLDEGEVGLGLGISAAGDVELLATPTRRVATGALSFEVDASWRVPEITAEVLGGQSLHPQLLTRDDRLDGERTVRLRSVSTMGRGEAALVAAGADEPIDAAVAAAAAAGAALVIAYPTDDAGLVGLLEPAEVPVLAVPADEGARLARLAAGRRATRVHLTGEYAPTRLYELVRVWERRIPAGADVVVPADQLAAVTETYSTMAGPGTAQQVEVPASSVGGLYWSQPVPLGGTRTVHLSPGFAWFAVLDYGAFPEPELGFTVPVVSWTETTEATTAGEHTQRSWLRQVSRPAVPTTGVWSGRFGDEVYAYVPLWTDGDGRAGDPWILDEVAWRLTSRGTEIASGQDPWVQAVLPARRAWYELTLDAALTSDPTWRLSTSTHTTWTFPSRHTDQEAVTAQLPLLALDADLPLRSDNTAAAHRMLTFAIDVRVPEGVAASRVTSLVVQTSTDDGATWRTAAVRRADADSFAVTVRNGAAGDVALRVVAVRADGISVTQEVQAAYRVR